ncbi:MAG: sugar phosphate isomerase/epimerase family protein [Planctomycetota bacterium]
MSWRSSRAGSSEDHSAAASSSSFSGDGFFDRGLEYFEHVARLGFEGIEIAPFNVAEDVNDISADRRQDLRNRAADAGIEIVGLHWLLVSPKGLHLTRGDDAIRAKTVAYLQSLAKLCADLGGNVMILGSPAQRNLEDGVTYEAAFERAAAGLKEVGKACGDCGVQLCLEPLNPKETNFLQTVEEALQLAKAIDHPNVGYMLDCKAMSGMPKGIEGTTREHGARAGHFHTNDPSGKGPGMGDLEFGPVLAALKDSGYEGWVSSEPFDYEPDSETVARTALETLKAAL